MKPILCVMVIGFLLIGFGRATDTTNISKSSPEVRGYIDTSYQHNLK